MVEIGRRYKGPGVPGVQVPLRVSDVECENEENDGRNLVKPRTHERISLGLGGAECQASIIQQRTMTRLPFGCLDLPHSRAPSKTKCTRET